MIAIGAPGSTGTHATRGTATAGKAGGGQGANVQFSAMLSALMHAQQVVPPKAATLSLDQLAEATVSDAEIASDETLDGAHIETEDGGKGAGSSRKDEVHSGTAHTGYAAHARSAAPFATATHTTMKDKTPDDSLDTTPVPATTTLGSDTDGELDEVDDGLVSTSTASLTAAKTGTRATRRAAALGRAETATSVLDADFAARLSRVLDRMREAGHEVEVVETLRTPERQRALYNQGRATPGTVVTWTLKSRHLEGKAADIRVDGRTKGAGYRLLHQIAQEEGLKTLGIRDRGHLELPRTTGEYTNVLYDQAGDSTGSPRRGVVLPLRPAPAAPATPATPATVASVATVARVATTAPVAASGLTTKGSARGQLPTKVLLFPAESTGTDGTTDRKSAGRSEDATRDTNTNSTADATKATSLGTHGSKSAGASAERNAENSAERSTEESGNAKPTRAPHARSGSKTAGTNSAKADREANTSGADTALRAHTTPSGAIRPSAPIARTGSLAAARIADLLAERDALPPRSVGELRLMLDPRRDGLQEVRLTMDGAALDATLHTSDPHMARGLRSDLASLGRILERQGFESARVSIALEGAQHARATTLDTVAAGEATARERELRGDSDAAREGRDQHTRHDSRHDAQRDRQHQQYFGARRPRPF